MNGDRFRPGDRVLVTSGALPRPRRGRVLRHIDDAEAGEPPGGWVVLLDGYKRPRSFAAHVVNGLSVVDRLAELAP